MTHNSKGGNKDYELKSEYVMNQIIEITCLAVVLKDVRLWHQGKKCD